MPTRTAVIVDIVGSRKLDDRAAGQSAVREAFDAAERLAGSQTPLWSTAGDEFQAIYASPAAACVATTIVRLALAEGIDVRFGIGIGESRTIENSSDGPDVLDGSAWWNARAAIEEAERRGSKSATARSWLEGEGSGEFTPALLLRDHIITSMRPRERRIALGLIQGKLQSEIAEAESVSQSAVSQSARRSGANALAQAVAQWREVIA